MSRQILSIDIRNDVLAAVLINTGLKGVTVLGSAYLPIAAQSEDGDALTESLALIVEQLKPTTANAVISLPTDSTLFRFISVPFSEDSKIRQILPFELEPTLPVSADSLKMDFQKTIMGDHTEVLAVAIDKTVYQNCMSKLASANIRPQLVVPAGFPLIAQITAIEHQPDAKTLFLDTTVDKSTLFALRSGHIEMVRNLPSGVGDETTIEALSLRVRQTITAWNDTTSSDSPPSLIYVSGPGLHDNPADVDRLSQVLEIPVQSIDLRQWLPRVEIPADVQWIPHLMNEALALAVLEAEQKPCPNFHRISSPLRNYWSAYRPYITVPAILLALVLIMASGGVLMTNYYLKKQVDQLDAQLTQVFESTFPGSRITAKPLEQMQSKLKELKKGGTDSELNAAQVRTIDVLLQISQGIPESVKVLLTRMTIGSNEVNVSGETTDFNAVDAIKNQLEKSDLFKQITIASANMDKSGNKVLFKLKIDL